ncbi:LacI family DNA-binding transcriptional regulator [Microlunatus speluncae]|uniref:LacI family DNA-binding transcriptional regulator n=1 Tax=Microlunatus speluncae TaxID=2594267 RepID=UPI0012664FEB|nr:LacI family DNA-binding transcriptional regulator [Microlunatus speluncae]
MARLVDVAAAAGVSVGLVSRVLNGDPATRATEETRQRVQRAADRLGYRPNHAARALRSARTYTIGLVVPDLTNALFAELMRGVEEASARLGYTVLLGRSEALTDQARISRLLDDGRVDGFLLQGRDADTTESLAAVAGTAPVVVINSRMRHRRGSVMLDDQAAGRVAAEFLIQRGHRRIGLINGPRSLLTARLRAAGFRSAMRDAGLPVSPKAITWVGYTVPDAAPALESIMSAAHPPSAVVVGNVNAAMGVLTEARRIGLSVPGELSVIAIHDAWTAAHTWPPLSTVKLPLDRLGEQAVEALHRRLEGRPGEDQLLDDVAPEVIVRESVADRG